MSHIVLQDIWISSVRLQLNLHVVYTPTQACILGEPVVTRRPQAQPDRLYFVEWESLREKDNAQRLLLL